MSGLTRSEKTARCQKAIGYRFRDVKLLETALTHTSGAATPRESNERMEFLGDAVLGLIITDKLYRTFPDLREGPLSIIKGSVVSRRACARIAHTLGLSEFLFLGKGMNAIPESILANAIESVIAAVYLDGGYDPARRFVESVFHDEFEEASRTMDGDNHKSELQTLTQHEGGALKPIYHILDEQGPEHRKCFKVQAQIGERFFRAAWGNTKKAAEQKAAENAVAELAGELPPWPDGD
ncbi:MAG: ribonuclease III [Thermoguttaceae bacterium]|nr:ribonuclease III [Thermoguttaceae bacterium]